MKRKATAKIYLATRYRELCKRYLSLSDKVSERQYISANLESVLSSNHWEKIGIGMGKV